jgi:hypothetical protein
MKFKKILPPPQSKESEDDPNYSLKKYSKQLLKRTITPDEFREVLRSHGINPMIEGINKVVRDHEVGRFVKFSELLNAVVRNRDSKFDPTQIKFDIRTKKFNAEAYETENGTSSMVPSGNGTGQLVYFSKKRNVESKYHTHNSNKELFDWDLSLLKKIKSGELNNVVNKNDPGHKHVFESNVFDDRPIYDSPKKRHTSDVFNGTGDIFTWKSDGKENLTVIKEITRRNPNERAEEVKVKERKVKVNPMMITSQENVLSGKIKK